MAEITAQLVKDLRERTGAGMMECRVRSQSEGDLSEAEVVCARGHCPAGKKAAAATKQGSHRNLHSSRRPTRRDARGQLRIDFVAPYRRLRICSTTCDAYRRRRSSIRAQGRRDAGCHRKEKDIQRARVIAEGKRRRWRQDRGRPHGQYYEEVCLYSSRREGEHPPQWKISSRRRSRSW